MSGAPAEVEVGIVTPDADALVVFYQEGLGFDLISTFTFPQGTVHRLRRGTARCKLFQPSDGPVVRPLREPWYAESGVAYAALLVGDVEIELTRAVGAGATELLPVTSHRPGARCAIVRDPEGNVWELLEES